MSDLGKRIARVDVLIGGVDQAKEQVEQLKGKVKLLREEADKAKERMENAVNTVQYAKYQEEYEKARKEYDSTNRALQTTNRNIQTVRDYLTNISGQTLRNLNIAKRTLNQMLLGIKPDNFKALDTVRGFIKEVTDEAQRRKGTLIEFADVFKDIGTASDQSLSMARKRLEDLISTTEKNNDVLSKYKEQLHIVREEEMQRKAAAADQIMSNLSGSTVSEIQEAIKATEQLRDAQSRGNAEWEYYNIQVKEANKYLDDFSRRAISNDMIDRFRRLSEASNESLQEQKKYWQGMADGARNGTPALNIYLEKLKAIRLEEEAREAKRTDKVMSDLPNSSVAEIREAIKATEQLRDAQTLGSAGWEKYNAQINAASKYLSDYTDAERWMDMESRFQNLNEASAASLEEQKKYWQTLVDGAEYGTQELDQYLLKVREIQKEEKRRNLRHVQEVFGHPNSHSDAEIRESVKQLEKLRDSLNRNDPAWEMYSRAINKANKYLKDHANELRKAEITEQMKNIGNLSETALADVKKFWQEQYEGAEKSDVEIGVYLQKLKLVKEEEDRRLASRAKDTIFKVQSDSFDATISETKEAIKLMEQYRQTLMVDDEEGIETVDSVVEKLNEKLNKTTQSIISYDEAMKRARSVSEGTFKGTIEELESLKKILVELRAKTNVNDKARLDEIDKQLGDIEGKMADINANSSNVKETLDNIHSAPLNKLKEAAAKLQAQLSTAATNTTEFVTASADLRRVNARIREVSRSWEEHDNQIVATIKRLTSYVLVYAGFNQAWGQIKTLTSANLELSDSLADIRKTTGLTSDAVAELSAEIDKIDTRTSQKELHDLAYEAGKLGLKATEDILGFVKAGNQLIASLGEDLGGSEAVRSLMKINDLLGETTKLGVEKALLATGSAINELSQNSTASAGPIADIVARLGAVGAQAKLTMADLIAIGGTADELSQDAEVVGTAMSKFITSLQTNTHSIAQAVDIDDSVLERLMKGGQTMEAMLMVLEKMKNVDISTIEPIMKEFGSDGERLKRVVSVLSLHVDTLRERVNLSNESFSEAISITKEYNIRNESTMALVERMGNTFRESFVNSANEGVLRNIIILFGSFVELCKNHIGTIKAITVAIIGLTTAVTVNSLAWTKNMKSIKGVGTALKTLFLAISKNPIALLTTALTTAASALILFARSSKKAVSSVKDFVGEMHKEQTQVDALFHNLSKLKKGTKEYKDVIDAINKTYGDYLGFKLTENETNAKLAASQELINAKIREGLALRMKEKMNASSVEKFGSRMQSAVGSMQEGLEKQEGFPVVMAPKALNTIQDYVQKNIDKPLDQILADVKQIMDKDFPAAISKMGYSAFDAVKSGLKDLIKAKKEFNRELEITDQTVKKELEYSHEETVKSTANMLMEITNDYNSLKKKRDEALSSKEEHAYDLQMYEKAKLYLKKAKELTPDDMGAETWETLADAVAKYEANVDSLEKKLGKFSIWGKGKTIEDASVQQMVDMYAKLHKERKSMKEDGDYSVIYGAKFESRKSAMEQYLKDMKEIEKKLASMGYNTSGGFLKDKKGGRKGEHEAKERINAAMAALEAYYNREQQLITQSFINKEITEEEYRKRSLDKEEEHLKDRILLRKRILGKQGGEKFNQGKYVHTDSDTGEITEYFKDKNLDTLQALMKKFGDTMTDGMFNKLTEDELKLFEQTVQHIKKVQQILLDNDFTGKVDKQYQDEIEKLDLFWSDYEEVSQEHASGRLDALRDLSKEAYSIDAAGLQERMEKNSEFSDWTIGRTSQDYEALLLMLQKYYDDYEEAENREMARRQRISDKKWKKDGFESSWEKSDDENERDLDMAKNMQGLGLLDQGSVDDAEIKLYSDRLLAAQAYYEFIQKNGGDLLEAETKRNEAFLALDAAEAESTKHKLETMKQYTDAVVEFSGQMGEAAFGEVADRKAAAKQLLRTTMELTKNLIMEQVKRLIMKKAMGAQEVAVEQGIQTAATVAHGTAAVKELTVEGAKTAAVTSLGIAQGSAKTIGQLGWWGIPLIAVISAALTALMGMAMGKMNKAKKEVAATTGVGSVSKGRVAAGMLTYAHGDYPILGNDGKVYNASYQKELKTGVYSGGAHFGLFSEKKPEMIVDGDTTQKIMIDYPHLYESILTIAKHGRLRDSMPTFASGSYPTLPVRNVQHESQAQAPDTQQLTETLVVLSDTVQKLRYRLDKPINAVVDPYGKKGAVRQMDKAQRFMRKTGQL